MRARIGVALALALAGCSGSGGTAVDADAGADADAFVKTDASKADADARPDADAQRPETAVDLVSDRGGAVESGQAHADAPPDTNTAETNPEAPAGSDGGDAGDVLVAPPDAPKTCAMAAQALTLPTGPVMGTLTGPSANPVVSCQLLTQTLGSDAFFRLKVDTFSTVEIVVQSPITTFLSVRPGCGDDGTELSCASQPLDSTPASTGFAGSNGGFTGAAGSGGPIFVDGGFGVPAPAFDASASTGAAGTGGAAFDASTTGAAGSAADASGDSGVPTGTGLRVRLAPGTYTIIVDTFADAGSAPFTLTARVVTPADNATCATPQVVEPATTVRGKLDLAGSPRVGCSGASNAPLYYAVGVPPGQRLTARVAPLLAGDRSWLPRIEALNTCSQGMACLAQGHSSTGSVQQLDWVNNSTNWRLVTLAVSADGPVNGAQFDLIATVTDLLATCSRPTPLKDGMALFSQDITAAPSAGMNTCGVFNDHALYYSATLLPQQSMNIMTVGSSSQSQFASPVNVGIRSSCDVNTCLPNNAGIPGSATFTNSTDATVVVIVEISPSGNMFDPRYDLRVQMPLPPAGVIVTPTGGLLTSESGQTATFTVALKSPPTKAVTFTVASDTPAEGTASPGTLTFDPTNWGTPQTVTVTGVDDHNADGSRQYTVAVGAASSADPRYAALDPPDVAVTNLDDEPGLLITGGDGIVTSEGGAQATFTVRLNSKPTDTVRLPVSSTDTGEGTVSAAELTFGTADWNTPKTVTVTGVDDVAADGTQAYTIVLGAITSNDASYAGLDPADLAAHNRDDDYQPVALKLLSTDTCGFPIRGGIAADSFGTMYVLLFCNSKLSVISSSDGGVTFTSPVLIPDSSDLGGDLLLAAGGGGLVYVAFEVPGFGLMLTTSRDGGATWSQRTQLMATAGNVHLSAGGQTVVATATTPTGASAAMVRSTDGGRSFSTPRLFDAFTVDVDVSSDGQTVWVPELGGNNKLHGSMDAGATFSDFGNIDLTFGPFDFGPRHLFQTGGAFLQIVNLNDTTMVRTVTNNNQSGQSFSIVVDGTETATLLQLSADSNHTEAIRFSEMGLASPAKTLGPRGDIAFAVPLSAKAIATIIYTGGLPLFTVTTF
jgi:hypothetical protein